MERALTGRFVRVDTILDLCWQSTSTLRAWSKRAGRVGAGVSGRFRHGHTNRPFGRIAWHAWWVADPSLPSLQPFLAHPLL